MPRIWILFIAALIALPGSLAAVFATIAERDFVLRGYVDATTTTNLPYRLPRFGVNAELFQYSDDELRQQFDWMHQAHVTWIRQFVRWNELEPERGTYQWDAWDNLVRLLADYPEFRLVAVIMNTPAWARPAPLTDRLTAPPADPATLANFARTFAARYGDSIDFYQIWDEPNLDDAWGLSDPRPAEYAAMLQAAYTAIHSADPAATVIAAALAPTTETGGQNISDILYLEDLYALSANQYFDAAAAKPYGFNTAPDDRRVQSDILNFSRIIALREIMVKHGDGKKALWASHFGWNALPESWPGAPSIWGSVSAQQQRDYTMQALARADREWPWPGGMILHHWQPDAPSDDPQWGFAVIDANNQPTTLWQTLTHQTPESARNGVFHPITPFARYSGLWTFGPRGADIGWLETSDSQLEFDFTGRDMALWLREDNYVAFLYPTVDGQPANAVPRDSSGNAYIFLQSDTLKPELNAVPVSRNLADRPHTLHVIADKGWDRWALAGYAVSSGNLAEPYNRQIAVGWLTVIFSGLAVITTGRQLPWQSILKPMDGLVNRLNDTGQIAISAVTSLALMAGMLLTWGDGTPALFRRDVLQSGLIIVLTGGLLIVQPGFLLTLIAGIVLFILIYNRLKIGLLLTLFYAPFFLFPVGLNQFAFPMSEICLLLTAGAWLLQLLAAWGRIRQSASSQFPIAWLYGRLMQLHPLDWGILLWVALGVLSLAWTQYIPQAVTELRTMLIEPALFYLIFRTIPHDKKDLLRLVDVLILTGFLVSVIGLFLYFRCLLLDICVSVIQAEGGARRLASVYGSPNNVGLWLGRCIPFALAYVLTAIQFTTGGLETRPCNLRRIFAGIALTLMLITVILTQSAGAILFGVPAGLAGVILLHYGRRARLPLAGMLATGGVLVMILAQFSPRFAGLFLSDRGTNFIRLRVWESTLDIIRNHPLTGLGLDQFLYAYTGQYIRPDAIADKDLSHPHNFILDFWIRLGLTGMLLFFWIQVTFWRSAVRSYRQFRQRDSVYHALIIATMGSMAALLAHGLIDNSVFVKDLAYVFVFLIAIIRTIANARSIDEYPD